MGPIQQYRLSVKYDEQTSHWSACMISIQKDPPPRDVRMCSYPKKWTCHFCLGENGGRREWAVLRIKGGKKRNLSPTFIFFPIRWSCARTARVN